MFCFHDEAIQNIIFIIIISQIEKFLFEVTHNQLAFTAKGFFYLNHNYVQRVSIMQIKIVQLLI